MVSGARSSPTVGADRAMGDGMRFRLAGKSAVVTGGASGIGEAVTRVLVEQGARVTIADVNRVRGKEIATQLGFLAAFVRCDVTDAAELRAVVEHATAISGRLDILVNCAGVGHVGDVLEVSDDDWQRLLAVNISGTLHAMRAAIDTMVSQSPSGGAIVNIGSVAALVGLRRRFAYTATKGAVVAMTRQAAVDFADKGVRCNVICPGTIETPFVDDYLQRFHAHEMDEIRAQLHQRQLIGRMGRPDEIASMVAAIVSDEARFMTGSVVVIDGGLTAQ